MTKETQDLIWSALSKEEREEKRNDYRIVSKNPRLDRGDSIYLTTLENIFGSHNLTSDTEPEEMLMVSKKQVMTELCRAANLQNDREEDWIRAGEEIEFTLTQLFGDKCLPEKEEPKPKFKAGDEVWYGVNKCTINKIEGNTAYIVYNNGASWENISQLRPYIEPNYKFGIGDKVKFRNSKIKIVRRRFASPYDNEAHYSVETLDGQSPINVVESDLQPYTEESRNLSQETANCDKSEDNQLKNNMEDKELNLCELLKDCPRGESLFSISQGAVKLINGQSTCKGYPIQIYCDGSNEVFLRTADGKVQKEGLADLYPSEGLLRKYPFNPEGAWMEWASERKPKRWRAKSSAGVAVSECEGHWEDYSYWYITSDGVIAQEEEMNCKADNLRYKLGNYFRTKEEAEQAAEAVRDMLEKFHENHTEK